MMLINDEPRRKWISIKTDPSSVWSNSLILYKNTSINCVNPAGNIWFKCLENDGNYIYHHEALCLHTRTLTSASPAKKSSHPKNIINYVRGEVGTGRWWCSLSPISVDGDGRIRSIFIFECWEIITITRLLKDST